MSRGILLDTHILVALVNNKDMLGKTSRHVVQAHNRLLYSPLSIAELRLKEEVTGKSFVAHDVVSALHNAGYMELPLESEAAMGITRFPALVGHDPFDRLLLAQAAHHNALFITADRRLVDLNLEFVHDAHQ